MTLDMGTPTSFITGSVAVAQPFFDLMKTPTMWIIGIMLGFGILGWLIYHFGIAVHHGR